MARKTTRKSAPSVSEPEATGELYAYDQIASTYFGDWVRDQMLEASKLPPEGVLPLETKADAQVVAKNMLRQLEVDTKRDLRGEELEGLIGAPTQTAHREFFEGFRKACDASRDWLADELLRIKGEIWAEAPKKVDPTAWYIDLYEGERVVRTFGPFASKEATRTVTRSRARSGLAWGDPYQGMDMGHPLKETHRPKARGSAPRRPHASAKRA